MKNEGWIPVSTELPHNADDVLVKVGAGRDPELVDSQMAVAFYQPPNGKWYTSVHNKEIEQPVTHWRKLPAPPSVTPEGATNAS